MKPRMRYWNGYYWCRRMGITGQGLTMEDAWNDMWHLYREMVKESHSRIPYNYRQANG
jgi:hypothetical protein